MHVMTSLVSPRCRSFMGVAWDVCYVHIPIVSTFVRVTMFISENE